MSDKEEMSAFEMYVAWRKLMTFEPWQAWTLIGIFILCGLIIIGELIYVLVTL